MADGGRILVIGGGSWGTAFAHHLASSRRAVKLWIREKEIIDAMKKSHENPVFLPGIRLSANLVPVDDLKEEAAEADVLIFAVPSKFIRHIFELLRGTVRTQQVIVNLTKGFEAGTLKTISQIAEEIFGSAVLSRWITLSGPSFAQELARKHPTTVVGASANQKVLEKIQKGFSSAALRIYRSDDLRGIEVGGSVKNIMAIAAGMVNRLGYGYNTTASLVTRGSIEISRFGMRLGAKPETFWGLAGIGDLMLTCFGTLSRNFHLGQEIAAGKSLADIENSTLMVAEGVETTKAVRDISVKLKVDMPISTEVYRVLFQGKKPEAAIRDLMKRSLKKEWNIN
jgi:glycerol-3-phosphate dehydrogenase (NAD(P)+)